VTIKMMISDVSRVAGILLLCTCAGGCNADEEAGTRFSLADHSYDANNMTQYQLPRELREISGLALTATGEVLAHNDEQAVIYRLDADKGRILGSFHFGQQPARDDFEGITTLGRRVFLIASSGALYEAKIPVVDEDADPAISIPVSYERYQVELPCEVEGLATLAATTLLAVCKTLTDGDDVLRIYAWSVADQHYLSKPYLSLDRTAFTGVVSKLKKLKPAGIDITDNAHLLIVGRHGKDPVVVEIDADGSVLGLQNLPDSRLHPQPEGITLSRTAMLMIADEGSKSDQNNRRGRLGVYQPK
jgi:uncharacterized protein YjiK